jgi:23S rRNA (uracil1939-C5)-methyltransferase
MSRNPLPEHDLDQASRDVSAPEHDRIRPTSSGHSASDPSRVTTTSSGTTILASTTATVPEAKDDDVYDLPTPQRRSSATVVAGLPPVELAVTAVGHGGEAVGRHDGMVAFVTGALPGETATIRITEKRPAFMRGVATKITDPSNDRATPACEHFGQCGGCHWQHATYRAQLAYKSQVLLEQLTRLGGVKDPPMEPPIPSPSALRYRNQIQIVPGIDDGGKRTLNYLSAPVAFGPHANDDIYRDGDDRGLHPIDNCPIASPDISRALQTLPWDTIPLATWERLEGIVLRFAPPIIGIALVATRLKDLAPRPVRGKPTPSIPQRDEQGVGHGLHVTFVCRAPIARKELRPFVQHAPVTVPDLAGVLVARNRGHHGTLLWGAPALAFEVGEDVLAVPAGAFFQVNLAAAKHLVARVHEWLAPAPNSQIIDAYAGVGLFAIHLSPHAGAIVAIESDDVAAAGAYHNVAVLRRTNINILQEPVEEALPRLARGDAVVDRLLILDPPRRGVNLAVVDAVRDLAPVRIAYVSCNPNSLARDIRRLGEVGYRVARTGVVDLFPQTYHIESVTLLERVARSGVD